MARVENSPTQVQPFEEDEKFSNLRPDDPFRGLELKVNPFYASKPLIGGGYGRKGGLNIHRAGRRGFCLRRTKELEVS